LPAIHIRPERAYRGNRLRSGIADAEAGKSRNFFWFSRYIFQKYIFSTIPEKVQVLKQENPAHFTPEN